MAHADLFADIDRLEATLADNDAPDNQSIQQPHADESDAEMSDQFSVSIMLSNICCS